MKKVTAAIIFKNNYVLLTRRSIDQSLGGYWEFPGGKMENNETPQECLERELSEELGVGATAGKIICESVYEYDHGVIKLLAIETKIESENFFLSVHDKIEWVQLEDLMNYKLAPADIPIAKTIIENSSNV
jgi:8-oxo-dGTP diphosphatase